MAGNPDEPDLFEAAFDGAEPLPGAESGGAAAESDLFEAAYADTQPTPAAADTTPANGQAVAQVAAPSPRPAPERSFGQGVGDALGDTDTWLAFAKGAAQGLGKYGEPAGHAYADLDARKTGEALYPGMGGSPGETVKTGKSLLQNVPTNPTTLLAEGLGTAATGIPAMLAAGPSVTGQMGMGAALGGARGGEEGGAKGALAGLLTGGAAGLVGGGLAKYGVPALAQADIPAWASITGLATKPLVTAPLLAAKLASRANPYLSELAVRGVGGFAAGLGGSAANFLGSKLKEAARYSPTDALTEPAKAKAQEVAYAGTPTTSWAVQSVLTSGTSGLSPEDEQRLTEAVMSGDDQKVISTNFLLSQRNPAYAKRMQDEYESLQHGGE